MNNLKSILIFGAGAAIGALASHYLTKTKYESILEEEIQSVKDIYKKKAEKINCEEQVEEKIENEDIEEAPQVSEKDKTLYGSILKESGYVNYNKYSNNKDEYKEKNEPESEIDPQDRPYIINAEEYGEEPGYDTVTLTYFADKVLVDDVDDIVEHVDAVVGFDNLKVFEEFGASSVYVRNDNLLVDYEILKDDFNYSDLVDKPSMEEIEEYIAEKKPHEI